MIRAPFPWYGGKRRIAPDVWKRFGDDLGVYVEPFAGSLACLLYRMVPVAREIVCDTDGGLCNFWRAIKQDHRQVAYWADYPTVHQDLTARHKWLIQWSLDNADRLMADPDYCDFKAAGWWVWGVGLWIGGGWCQTHADKIPWINPMPGGRGVMAQSTVPDKLAYAKESETPLDGNELEGWFHRLAERMKGVIVLNRSWEAALTPTKLQQTPSAPAPPVGIFMDPPYVADGSRELYGSDAEGSSTATAWAAYEWAIEHGEQFRIAYCAHDGDFEWPEGWETDVRSFRVGRKGEADLVAYSPACVKKSTQQVAMF